MYGGGGGGEVATMYGGRTGNMIGLRDITVFLSSLGAHPRHQVM